MLLPARKTSINSVELGGCYCKMFGGLHFSHVGRIKEVAVRLGPISTGMGDRLRAAMPCRYVTSHPGQLSLAIRP